jgi:hypothetical protein
MNELAANDFDDPILGVFPTFGQLEKMRRLRTYLGKIDRNVTNEDVKEYLTTEFQQSTPYYCPIGQTLNPSKSREVYNDSVRKNEKKPPKSIRTERTRECILQCERLINYLGSESQTLKGQGKSLIERGDIPVNLLDDKYVQRSIKRDKEIMSFAPNEMKEVQYMNFNQLCDVYVKLAKDVTYMPRLTKKGFYYSIPTNGACINVICTGFNQKTNNPYVSFFSITRIHDEDFMSNESMLFSRPNLSDHCNITRIGKVNFLMSKMQKYDLSRLVSTRHSKSVVQTALVSMISMMGQEMPKMQLYKVAGLMSLLALDLHQNPSIIVDLMKYLVGITTSLISNLDKLIEDNLGIMRKTYFDVFLIEKVYEYCDKNLRNSINMKYKETDKNIGLISKNYAIKTEWTSFMGFTHMSAGYHFTEASLMNQLRPKALYGSQFVDTIVKQTVEFNLSQMKSRDNTRLSRDGFGDLDDFDLGFSHCFSRDAVHCATLTNNKTSAMHVQSCHNSQAYESRGFAMKSLSMRGACKTHEQIKNDAKSTSKKVRKSETSLYASLTGNMKEILEDDSESMRLINFVRRHEESQMVFNMSEKIQRAKGRITGSPDYVTKQRLRLVESVFKKIGEYENENMLIRGVNKMASITNMVNSVVGKMDQNDKLYHLVMDQSKFSEGDNLEKFIPMIYANDLIDRNLKRDLVVIIRSMEKRLHYFRKINVGRYSDEELEMINGDGSVICTAGWVQGMFNYMSTHLHIICARWLSKIFIEYYPGQKQAELSIKEAEETITPEEIAVLRYLRRERFDFKIEHKINSDDSYAVFKAKSDIIARDFYSFFEIGKKLFCLKQNVKKSYMSPIIGEIVQKYVLNGYSLNIWAKQAVSAFEGVLGLDPGKDSVYVTSILGSLMKEGCPEVVCHYIRCLLMDSLYSMYQTGLGKRNDISTLGMDIRLIPCEFGGMPELVSTFELCWSNTAAQQRLCHRYCQKFPESEETNLLKGSMHLMMSHRDKSKKWKVMIGPSGLKTIGYLPNYDTTQQTAEYIKVFGDDEDGDKVINYINDTKVVVEDGTLITDELDMRGEAYIIQNMNDMPEDVTMLKTFLSPFSFCLRLSKKNMVTVKTMSEVQNQIVKSSGLSGICTINTSIQLYVADLIDGFNKKVLEWVESGFMNDPRKMARGTADLVTKRNTMIRGFDKPVNLMDGFDIVRSIGSKMVNLNDTELWTWAMSNYDTRADISSDAIATRLTITSKVKKHIVNVLPLPNDEAMFRNPLAVVACEVLEPGFYEKQGNSIPMRGEIMKDRYMMNNMIEMWLRLGMTKRSVVLNMVQEMIRLRRKRFLISQHIDNINWERVIIDASRVCVDGVYQYSTQLSAGLGNTARKTENENLCVSIHNVIMRCELDGVRDYRDVKVRFESQEGKIKELPITSQEVERAFIKSITQGSKQELRDNLAVSYMLLFDDERFIVEVAKDRTSRIHWISPQPYRKILGLNNEVIKDYYGSFIVQISLGDSTAVVRGKPGEIESISANTRDHRELSKMLRTLTDRVPFTGFMRTSKREHWFRDPFWRGTREMMLGAGYVESFRIDSHVPYVDTNHKWLDYDYTKEIRFVYDTTLESEGDNLANVSSVKFDNKTCSLYITKSEMVSHRVMGTDGEYTESVKTEEIKRRIMNLKTNFRGVDYSRLVFGDLKIHDIKLSEITEFELMSKVIADGLIGLSDHEMMRLLSNTEFSVTVIKNMFINMTNDAKGETIVDNDDLANVKITKYRVNLGAEIDMKAFEEVSDWNELFNEQDETFGTKLEDTIERRYNTMTRLWHILPKEEVKTIVNSFLMSEIYPMIAGSELDYVDFEIRMDQLLDKEHFNLKNKLFKLALKSGLWSKEIMSSYRLEYENKVKRVFGHNIRMDQVVGHNPLENNKIFEITSHNLKLWPGDQKDNDEDVGDVEGSDIEEEDFFGINKRNMELGEQEVSKRDAFVPLSDDSDEE